MSRATEQLLGPNVGAQIRLMSGGQKFEPNLSTVSFWSQLAWPWTYFQITRSTNKTTSSQNSNEQHRPFRTSMLTLQTFNSFPFALEFNTLQLRWHAKKIKQNEPNIDENENDKNSNTKTVP